MKTSDIFKKRSGDKAVENLNDPNMKSFEELEKDFNPEQNTIDMSKIKIQPNTYERNKAIEKTVRIHINHKPIHPDMTREEAIELFKKRYPEATDEVLNQISTPTMIRMGQRTEEAFLKGVAPAKLIKNEMLLKLISIAEDHIAASKRKLKKTKNDRERESIWQRIIQMEDTIYFIKYYGE